VPPKAASPTPAASSPPASPASRPATQPLPDSRPQQPAADPLPIAAVAGGVAAAVAALVAVLAAILLHRSKQRQQQGGGGGKQDEEGAKGLTLSSSMASSRTSTTIRLPSEPLAMLNSLPSQASSRTKLVLDEQGWADVDSLGEQLTVFRVHGFEAQRPVPEGSGPAPRRVVLQRSRVGPSPAPQGVAGDLAGALGDCWEAGAAHGGLWCRLAPGGEQGQEQGEALPPFHSFCCALEGCPGYGCERFWVAPKAGGTLLYLPFEGQPFVVADDKFASRRVTKRRADLSSEVRAAGLPAGVHGAQLLKEFQELL
jgi:hypothetical protein